MIGPPHRSELQLGVILNTTRVANDKVSLNIKIAFDGLQSDFFFQQVTFGNFQNAFLPTNHLAIWKFTVVFHPGQWFAFQKVILNGLRSGVALFVGLRSDFTFYQALCGTRLGFALQEVTCSYVFHRASIRILLSDSVLVKQIILLVDDRFFTYIHITIEFCLPTSPL